MGGAPSPVLAAGAAMHGCDRAEADTALVMLQALPIAAGVPGEYRNTRRQHLLGGDSLRLMSAEIDQRAAAPTKRMQLLFSVGAILQPLDLEPATAKLFEQNRTHGFFGLLAPVKNLVVEDDVNVLRRSR